MKVGVIGVGECFKEKMLPPLFNTTGFQVKWAVDVLPGSVIIDSLKRKGLNTDKTEYHHTDGFLSEIPSGDVDIVIDASPSRYHAHNVKLALESGKNIYVEKPYTINPEGVRTIDKALNSNDKNLAYFAEYYRDEKGLPLRLLTGDALKDTWYHQFISPVVSSSLGSVLSSIGKITKVYGNCMEGQGKKSGIGHRKWVGDMDQGGQLLDMSTHLFSFTTLLEPKIGNLKVESCYTGLCREFADEYVKWGGRYSDKPAETFAIVKGTTEEGCKVFFEFGKYTGVAERKLDIVGENGRVSMNFENQVMSVSSPAYNGDISVRSEPKYDIIVNDLQRKIRKWEKGRGSYTYGLDESKWTLAKILKAREIARPQVIYENGALPS